jgi:MFS transporter, OFA family, oxalate/formate antiporter
LKKPKVFYGYWVLFSCCLCGGITAGCGGNTISLFTKTLEADMGWSRTEIMTSFSILIAVICVTAPFVGRTVDRFGARRVICGGALVSSTGMLLLSHMSGLFHLYLAYVLLGLGAAATGAVTLTYVVSQWFSKRRGMAIGILATGMAVGGLIFLPLIAVWLIPHFGWRGAYRILTVIIALGIIPFCAAVVRTKPADVGLHPDNIPPVALHDSDVAGRHVLHIPLKSALTTSAFWFIAISLVLNHTHVGVFQSVFPHLKDMGFSTGVAASALSATSITACLGMFIFGWLCDKIRPQYASAIGLCVIALSIVILLNVGPGSPVTLIWFYAVVMGLGMGSWLTTMSTLTSSTFGIASYGTIFGVLTVFQAAGSGVGPLMAGYGYDSMHTYFWAFLVILIMVLLAVPLVLAVRQPHMETRSLDGWVEEEQRALTRRD